MNEATSNRKRLHAWLVCFALILPGSFLVLPLLWIWQRSRVR
jgi:hypothetical protein